MDKICVKTFGCSLNFADSERIRAALKERGFELCDTIDEAALVVVNSCAVKGPTEKKFFALLDKLNQQHKKIVIAGCISQAMPEKLNEYSKIGTDQLDAIGDVAEETLSGNVISVLVKEKKNKLTLASDRQNPLLEIIPISTGCKGSCTFCITKKARGVFCSNPAKDIIECVKKAKDEGVKEVYLTSQDNGCWGFDNDTDLAELLTEICKIEGNYMIRVGMANPNHVLKILDKLIQAFKHPRVYKFLHIPIQSGNNYVLEDMKRGYQVEDYIHIVNSFKKEIPNITISTDIIIGYPTESDAFFKDTVNLIKETKPDIMNLSRFWPRPHTIAADLEQLPGGVVKERVIEATSIFNWTAYEYNKRWKGWEGKVLITEKGKDESFIGRNFAYKQIILHENVEIGKWYNVKVIDSTNHDLRAKLI